LNPVMPSPGPAAEQAGRDFRALRRPGRRNRGNSQNLVLRVVPASEHSRIGEMWRTVEATAGEAVAPFARWDWTELWLERYADAVPHEYLVAERNGVPHGVALLTRSTLACGPLTVRRMHLGTAGEPEGGVFVEYNGLCAPRADHAELAVALVAHTYRTGGWDEFHLNGFDPAHAAPLLAAEPRFSVVQRESPVLQLDPSADDVVDSLRSKSARATVRRSLRGISPYTTEWARDGVRALAILDDLERLHQERWRARGEPGAFASERFRSFHRRLITRWVPEGRAVVFAVRGVDETVAALYGFVVGDTLQYYQGGFRMFDHNKVRAGYAGHLLLANAARDRGLKNYEFLAGDQRYKTELSTARRTLTWATLVRRRPRAMAIQAARTAGQALRQRRTDNMHHASEGQ
jgi:CelD/BcsL family acetyltransferase involved in cellulose biosynthesis